MTNQLEKVVTAAIVAAHFALSACGARIPISADGTAAIASPPRQLQPATDGAHDDEAPASVRAGLPTEAGPLTSNCDGSVSENLARGGVASASDESTDPTESAAAAFDDNTGTLWLESGNKTPWLAYEFGGGAAHVVTQYALGPSPSGSPADDPVDFRLEGSNGEGRAAVWTTLHRRENQHFIDRQLLIWFSFQNQTPYRRYRLLVTANGGGAGVQLGELQLFGPGSPSFSIDDTTAGPGLNRLSFGTGWEHGTRDTEVKEWKFGRSSSWSKQPNAQMSVTFEGSEVVLYGVRHTHHGIAAVRIDDGPEQLIDFYGPTAGNVVMYTSPRLCPPARHVLHVRVTGDKNALSGDTYISLDRVRVAP